MRGVWLLIAAGAVVGLDARACPAQSTATATIRAKVHPARRPPPRGPRSAAGVQSQTISVSADGPGLRGEFWSPAGEPIMLQVENATIKRISLLVSDAAAPGSSAAIECRGGRYGITAAPAVLQAPGPVCDELVIRWLDSANWPARLLISVRADRLEAERFVAGFTVVAEY